MSCTVGDFDARRLHANLAMLSTFGATREGGVDRQTYSPAYRAAIDWLAEEMRAAGLAVHLDPAGNLIGRMGPKGPALVCGSHIDSVTRGGRFDGTLGVLAGLECARSFREHSSRMKLGFEVIAFADEEGRFVSLLGSRAMLGMLTAEEIASGRNREGALVADAITQFGLAADRVLDARRPHGDFAGYIELHIEQGPVLEAAGFEIGIVDGVVGIARGDYELAGQANHSGTTPFALRRDAFRAAALGITRCYEALEAGLEGVVLNFGRIRVEPGAINVVPARAIVSQEIRSTDDAKTQRLQDLCLAAFARAARECRVECTWTRGDIDPAAIMRETVQARIGAACNAVGLRAMTMPSGAGHDAQLFGPICPTGMIFVPSRGGISHNPAEFTAPEQIENGLAALHETCRLWLYG